MNSVIKLEIICTIHTHIYSYIYLSIYTYELWKISKFHHRSLNGQPYCILKKDSIPEEKYNFNIQLYFSFIVLKILDVWIHFFNYFLFFSLEKFLGF